MLVNVQESAEANGAFEAAEAAQDQSIRSSESPAAPRSSSRDEITKMAKLIEQTAAAVHAAHEAGVVHRDIKPGNIMITPEGVPVILDFGLAHDARSERASLTQSGEFFGTPPYMAPEQVTEHADGDPVHRTAGLPATMTAAECRRLLEQRRSAPHGSRITLIIGLYIQIQRPLPTLMEAARIIAAA